MVFKEEKATKTTKYAIEKEKKPLFSSARWGCQTHIQLLMPKGVPVVPLSLS